MLSEKMQAALNEQIKIEAESSQVYLALARTMNDKLELIGDDKSGMYLFDRDILTISASIENG